MEVAAGEAADLIGLALRCSKRDKIGWLLRLAFITGRFRLMGWGDSTAAIRKRRNRQWPSLDGQHMTRFNDYGWWEPTRRYAPEPVAPDTPANIQAGDTFKLVWPGHQLDGKLLTCEMRQTRSHRSSGREYDVVTFTGPAGIRHVDVKWCRKNQPPLDVSSR